ncbi:MAG: hypothetical protein ACRDYV_09200, partial [Acidimicrobiia bacterium]
MARGSDRWIGSALAGGMTALVVGLWWRDIARPLEVTFSAPVPSPLAAASSYLLSLVPPAAAGLIWRSVRNPERRRRTSIVWDLATFWPRAVHPLAPPCYAERAVPELRERIEELTGDGRVMLCGHSQGSVLALATVAQLGPTAGRIGLVTYGSPVGAYYARLFPAQFGPAQVRAILRGLTRRDTGGPPLRPAARNYFRATDPISAPLLGDAEPPDGVLLAQVCLDDPPILTGAVQDGPPLGHSHYLDDPLMQEELNMMADALAGEAATPQREPDLTKVRYPTRKQLTDECDLVMKGGITSGVVYPLAACQLARTYRFRSLGGSSAGAIAAVMIAAAEYGRDDAGFQRLAMLPDEIGPVLPKLFKPGPDTGTAHAALMAAVDPKLENKLSAKIWRVLTRLIRAQQGAFLTTLIPLALALGALAWNAPKGFGDGLLLAARGLVFLGVAVVLAAARSLYLEGMRTWRSLGEQGFGICLGSDHTASRGSRPRSVSPNERPDTSGTEDPGYLTDWLAARIDWVANVEDTPLT